jgi:putative oxidoreductase
MSNLAQNFDLTNSYNVLRILCGLFLLPHLYAKSMNFNFMLGIYKEWRLNPPKAWLIASLTTEIICAPLLILGIYTKYVAILVAIFLFVATGAAWRYSKGKWLWNIGGCEYPFFWAIACVALAMASPN